MHLTVVVKFLPTAPIFSFLYFSLVSIMFPPSKNKNLDQNTPVFYLHHCETQALMHICFTPPRVRAGPLSNLSRGGQEVIIIALGCVGVWEVNQVGGSLSGKGHWVRHSGDETHQPDCRTSYSALRFPTLSVSHLSPAYLPSLGLVSWCVFLCSSAGVHCSMSVLTIRLTL